MTEVEHDAGPQQDDVGVEQHNGENENQKFEVPDDVKPPLPFLVFWDKIFLCVMKSASVYSKVCFWPMSLNTSNWFFTVTSMFALFNLSAALLRAYTGMTCPTEYTGFDGAIVLG